MSFLGGLIESFGSFVDNAAEIIWDDDPTILFTEDTSCDDTIFMPIDDNYSG